jgi:hypothetical protein
MPFPSFLEGFCIETFVGVVDHSVTLSTYDAPRILVRSADLSRDVKCEKPFWRNPLYRT